MGFVHYHDGILHLAARYTRSVIREETKPLSGLKCAVMGSVMKLKNLRLQLYKLFLLSGFSFQIFFGLERRTSNMIVQNPAVILHKSFRWQGCQKVCNQALCSATL